MNDMDNDAWFRFWTADWTSGTSRMLNDEVGAYLRLILDYYKNGPLPDETRVLIEISRVPATDWTRVWGTVCQKFTKSQDGLLHHERCDLEIQWRKDTYKQKLKASRLGVEKRRELGMLKEPHGQPTGQPHGQPEVLPGGQQNQNQNQNQSTEPEPKPESHTQEGACGTTVRLPVHFHALKESVGSMFQRRDGDRWNYDEETYLLEVARRPDAVTELGEIQRHRNSVKRDERRYLKGRDVLGLLRDWPQALDQARGSKPAQVLTPEQRKQEQIVLAQIKPLADKFRVKPASQINV
jgi:uncharacterized protein YdaU (DUF1376 family)